MKCGKRCNPDCWFFMFFPCFAMFYLSFRFFFACFGFHSFASCDSGLLIFVAITLLLCLSPYVAEVWERHVALRDDAGEKLLAKCREDRFASESVRSYRKYFAWVKSDILVLV